MTCSVLFSIVWMKIALHGETWALARARGGGGGYTAFAGRCFYFYRQFFALPLVTKWNMDWLTMVFLFFFVFLFSFFNM